jgi:pSer/pThr/pTyr-binding forkhead associated (FHA) protein
MRDGYTRRIETIEENGPFAEWLEKWQATVVVVSGDAAGTEYTVDRPTISIGRSPESGWCFEDDSMSKEHAALEFTAGSIRLRDLGSMNGTLVNGSDSKAAELKNGDRFQLGEHEFQFILEKRSRQPKTYVLDDE